MSGYTMTQQELLFSQDLAGTVTGTGSTAIQNACIGFAPIVIPGGFFANVGSYRTSSALLEWGGLLIATATVPTFQFSLAYTTTDTWSGTNLFAQSAATAPSAATTGIWFEARIHLAPRVLPVQTSGATTLATISVHGSVWLYYASGPQVYSIPGAAATFTPTAATIDTSIQTYIWPSFAIGTATAGNTITTEYVKLHGQN